jgi:hypothetical protein
MDLVCASKVLGFEKQDSKESIRIKVKRDIEFIFFVKVNGMCYTSNRDLQLHICIN